MKLSSTTRRRVSALAAAIAIPLASASIIAPSANAAPNAAGELHGINIPDGQKYAGKSAGGEWMGTYKFSGGEAWCVSFAEMEPAKVEQRGGKYIPGGVLTKKDGKPLSDEEHAVTAYAVSEGQKVLNDPKASQLDKTRYGAVVAYILHSYTAKHMPVGADKSWKEVGYDAPLHERALSEQGKALKDKLVADAKKYPGPWKIEVKPAGDSTEVGKPAEFKLSLKAANGTPIKQQVKLKGTQIDGVPATVETDDKGEAVFQATPKAKEAKIDAETEGNPGKLQMLKPDKGEGQNIVVAGPHKINSSTTDLISNDFGALNISKVTAGDTQSAPVKGAEISIYKAEDVKKALSGQSTSTSESEKPETTSSSAKPSEEEEETTTSAPSSSSTTSSSSASSSSTDSSAPQGTPNAGPDDEDDGTGEGTPTTESTTSAPSSSSSIPTTTSAPSSKTKTSTSAPSSSKDKDSTAPAVKSVSLPKEEKSKELLQALSSIKPIQTLTSDGQVLRGKMEPGEYVAVETKAPEGLELDATPHPFSIKSGEDSEVKLANNVKATLKKVDKETNKPISGAEFDIVECDNTSNVVASFQTGSDGTAVFSLPQGCYDAVEKKAPEGYQKADTPTRFDASIEKTEVVVTNMKVEQKPAPRAVKRVPVVKIPSGPVDGAAGSLPTVN